jgi:pyruvate kinase
MSRRLRRTKIVTTLGPADRDNNLEKIIAAGANVVRMNFSHGTPEDHQLRADKVRESRQNWAVMLPSSATCRDQNSRIDLQRR